MLAILGIIGKIIGVFYRLPLTNILGAEGMGLYQMVFPLYSLVLAISCGGIPTAISKYVSELNAKGGFGVKNALKVSVAIMAFLGGGAAIFIFVFRGSIANIQGNAKVAVAYAALAPAVIFSAIIACYRGYYQGLQNLLPSGISQLIEQTVKVIFGLLFAAIFLQKGVEYGVMGAIIGISISEFVAFFYLAVRLRFKSKSKIFSTIDSESAVDVMRVSNNENTWQIIKNIYSVAIPVTLGSLVLPLSQVMDSFLVVNLLQGSGVETTLATSLYGLFNGPVGSLLNMPTVVTVALAASLLPKIAFCRSKGISAADAVDKSLSAYFAIMLFCGALFAFAPQPILRILYSRGLTESELNIASNILRIESFNVVMVGFIQLTSALMQGVGSVKTPVFNLLVGALIKIAATVTLIPLMGIYGAAIANVVFYAVTCSLNAITAKRRYGAYFNFKIAKIFLCAVAFVAIFSSYFFFKTVMNEITAFIFATFISSAAYLLLLIKTKCILLREMLS